MSRYALGTIVESVPEPWSESQIYTGLLDYYDHWQTIDPRMAEHHECLSGAAQVLGNDIVNLATYAHEILNWLDPARIREGRSVVTVGGMAEAFLVSVRSACDAVAQAISYKASSKPGQVPKDMRGLLSWAQQNQARVEPAFLSLLSGDMNWFWNLRSLRDHIVHGGADANIQTDGRQFNLWVHSPTAGWVTREPLLPLLSKKYQRLISFSDEASKLINAAINLPSDRLRSRVVSGVLVPSLHRLVRIAGDYSDPSP